MLFRRRMLAAVLLSTMTFAGQSAEESKQYNKAGFVTFVEDGRLWVFKAGSAELEDFKKYGEPTKMATKIGEGPEGMTIKGIDIETVDAYLAAP